MLVLSYIWNAEMISNEIALFTVEPVIFAIQQLDSGPVDNLHTAGKGRSTLVSTTARALKLNLVVLVVRTSERAHIPPLLCLFTTDHAKGEKAQDSQPSPLAAFNIPHLAGSS